MNMMKFLPPRLRAPVNMIVGGSVITVIGVILNGWVAAAFLIPFTIICTAWYYVLGGGDSDLAAVLLGRGDERQAYRRLRMQALVGRVLSLAVGVICIAAVAAKATLWPVFVLVGLLPLTILAGWLIYREHPGGREQQVGPSGITAGWPGCRSGRRRTRAWRPGCRERDTWPRRARRRTRGAGSRSPA